MILNDSEIFIENLYTTSNDIHKLPAMVTTVPLTQHAGLHRTHELDIDRSQLFFSNFITPKI